jgi:RimJ/RimL family protein N-acetyltransferase
MSEIETARLRGRPCTPGDVGPIAALFGEPEVRRWTSPPGVDWTKDRFELIALRLSAHWLAHRWGPRLWFAGERFVGVAGLQFAIVAGRGVVEIAYAVLPAEQRRGYAREALAAILAEAPEIAREVVACVADGNARSLDLLARAGFLQTGAAEEEGRRVTLLARTFAG